MQRALVVAAVTAATVFVISLALFSRSHQNDLKSPPASAFKPIPAPRFAAVTLGGRKVSLAAYHGRAAGDQLLRQLVRAVQGGGGRVHKDGAAVRRAGCSSCPSAATPRSAACTATCPATASPGPSSTTTATRLTDQFRLYGQPTTFVINRRGVVIDRINGKTTEQTLAHELTPLVQS